MSKTRRPLPLVSRYRTRDGNIARVDLPDGFHEFDYDFLPEVRPMLLKSFDLEVVQYCLQRLVLLHEGILS